MASKRELAISELRRGMGPLSLKLYRWSHIFIFLKILRDRNYFDPLNQNEEVSTTADRHDPTPFLRSKMLTNLSMR